MGVLGAFVFAAQMINFAIPGTGSSGHIGGGLLLAVLLGPHAAFLVLASVLFVQALFFADGGLLALGCNLFNLGFFPAFIAFPMIYRPLAPSQASPSRRLLAALLAAVAGLQLGAFAVVMETSASGISALPFSKFVLLMQPIHMAIGLVEGLATWALLEFIRKAQPEVFETQKEHQSFWRSPAVLLLTLGVLLGGIFSWYASKNPDGLEWAMTRLTNAQELKAPEQKVHAAAAQIQEKTALMPDYAFKEHEGKAATSTAGLLGIGITLAFVALTGFVLRRRRTAP
jgi:cobalt/nickel transport system permease protein